MTKVKKSVLAFVAVLSLAFIMGAAIAGPDFGMNDGHSSTSSASEMMELAAKTEDGDHCC